METLAQWFDPSNGLISASKQQLQISKADDNTAFWYRTAYLLYLAVGANDERQTVGKFTHEGDVELRAVQVRHVGADVRQERELKVVRLLEVQVLTT